MWLSFFFKYFISATLFDNCYYYTSTFATTRTFFLPNIERYKRADRYDTKTGHEHEHTKHARARRGDARTPRVRDPQRWTARTRVNAKNPSDGRRDDDDGPRGRRSVTTAGATAGRGRPTSPVLRVTSRSRAKRPAGRGNGRWKIRTERRAKSRKNRESAAAATTRRLRGVRFAAHHNRVGRASLPYPARSAAPPR